MLYLVPLTRAQRIVTLRKLLVAQSRFCRSSKTLKRGMDFSEMIVNRSLSILEYSKFPTFVQGKLRNSYLRTKPNMGN